MLGAALTGAAVDSSMFIAGRAILGCGTGGIMTTATVLLVEAAPVKRRGLLVGVINTVITAGSSLGGVISGAFAASRWGWVSIALRSCGALLLPSSGTAENDAPRMDSIRDRHSCSKCLSRPSQRLASGYSRLPSDHATPV